MAHNSQPPRRGPNKKYEQKPVLFSPPHLLYRPAITGMVVETLPYPERLEDRLHALEDYSERTFKPVDSVLQEVVERARAHNMPNIHVGNMDGLTLEVVIRMAGYKKMVEVGALAGFSGILIARALGPGGHLHTIEFNPDYAEVARESFRKAGLEDRVTVHVGRAAQVLEQLAELGPFDGIFIDADKDNYPVYLDWAEENIRVGGAIFADNTFGFGHVWREADTIVDNPKLKSQVAGLRKINARLASNPNYRATILPTNQGLTMAVRLK